MGETLIGFGDDDNRIGLDGKLLSKVVINKNRDTCLIRINWL